MRLTLRAAVHAAMTAGVLLVGAMTSSAQAESSHRGDPVARGHGVYVGFNEEIKSMAMSVVERPDGTVRGWGYIAEPATRGFVLFDLSSYMFVDGALGVAGEVILAFNAPPEFARGTTIFLFFNDNDPASDEIAQGLVPPEVGNPTIQQIVELIGPPPPQVFRPFLAGNIRFF